MTIRAPLRVEARMRGRDVGWLWVLIRGEALRDSTGNVVRVLGSLTDITERKIVEQQLVAATSRFEALFIGSPDALLMVDRSGKIALANRAAGEMFCRNLEAFQNVAVDDVLIGSTPYVPKLKQTQIDITKPEPVGLVGVRHDGEQFPAEVTTRAIQVEPEEMWVFSIRDVTARIAAEASRQEMERKLQETQRLESLGVLARGIAHDFNNLLANIVGNVALVKFESEGNALPPALDEAMDGIQEASQRAAELCRQMLAYAGKGQIAKQLTDLTTLVRGSERLLRVSVNKRVALEFELPETTPGVEVDVTQISQVLMNLVINASESMGERCGRVRVSTGSIDLEQVIRERFRLFADIAEGRYAFLEVDDDGTGMSESTLARIFDPFFTTKFTGRGLGLAVVLGIVRGHGGAVAVRSVSGQGTVYRVLLPIAPPVALQSREVAVPVKRALRYGGCALVVDDERNVRVATGRLLQALGFEAVLADGCDAAVRFVKERGAEVRFAMIDLNMPGLGGSATARELRQSVPTLPIILISAYGRPEPLVSGSGSAGSTLFLQKPFLMRDVIDKLETLIGEQEADAGACPD
jgi:PAS domain S-box-containing protein